MNVFELRERLIGDYSSYIRSFIRIDRFGRRTLLNVYALLPSTDGFGASSDSVQLLRQVLGSASPGKGG